MPAPSQRPRSQDHLYILGHRDRFSRTETSREAMTAFRVSFSDLFEEQYKTMNAEEREIMYAILRPLGGLWMVTVSCDMCFGQIDIMIPLDNYVALLVVITDNPVRVTIQMERIMDE